MDNEIITTDSVRNPQRRTIMKAAAWAAPVVAVAATAPLAAASVPDSSDITVSVGGSITADPGDNPTDPGTASGTLNGSINVVHTRAEPWETGALTGGYSLTGPWTAGSSITKPDGSAFVVGETYGIWTVSAVIVDTVTGDVRGVRFTAPSQTVTSSVSFALPSAIYSGTFSTGTPNIFNPLGASVSVTSTNGISASQASLYPAE
ncbi:MAG: hypothetical protein QM606_08840 [Leucobacter sp.]